jgi:chromate transporter
MRILSLWWQFLLIGLVSFGGGTAMIPLLQRTFVDQEGWISLTMFVDIIGLSQVTPGPIAINAATFIGYQASYAEYGSVAVAFVGSLAATLGVITMPSIFMSIVIGIQHQDKVQQAMKRILYRLRPVLVGLIAVSALTIAELSFTSITHLVWFALAMIFLLSKKVHPIVVIILGGLYGVLFL